MTFLHDALISYHISQILVAVFASIIIPYLVWHYHKKEMLSVLIKTYYAQFLVFLFVVVGVVCFFVRGAQGLVYQNEGETQLNDFLWFCVKVSLAMTVFIYLLILVELYGLRINNRLIWIIGIVGIIIYGLIEIYAEGMLLLTGIIQLTVTLLFGWRLYTNGRKERNEWIALRKKRAALSITIAMLLEEFLAPLELQAFEYMNDPPTLLIYFIVILFVIRTFVVPAGTSYFALICANPVILLPMKDDFETMVHRVR
ncbi:MAG: hypothetical protein ACFFCQ_04450 [Promethearchaeota archaeon]